MDACKQPPSTVKSEFAVGCGTISTSGSWVVWYFCETNWAMFCVCFVSGSSLFPFGIPHGWLWKFPHHMSVSCCLPSRSLHRRACSHYEKYPLLHKISHTKLSWGEAAPMVVLSTLPIEKRHVAFSLLDCSATSDTLPREFPLLASRTTFFFSFSPMFHFCCFKKILFPT